MSTSDDPKLYTTKEVDGEVKVFINTIVEALQGTFTPSGLQREGRVTQISINESGWTKLPSNALDERNNISIQNRTGKTILLNFDSALAGSTGYDLDDQADFQMDIRGTIPVYARAKTGDGTLQITVMELA